MCLKYPTKLHVAGAISQRAASDCLVFQGNMEAQFCTSKVLVGTLRPFTVESFLEGHCFWQDSDPTKHMSRLAQECMWDHDNNW